MLSICVLNYNGKDYIEDCLKSIPIDIEAEKILIDNASTDESWKIAERYGFKVIHASNKHKFITGINTALYFAQGDHILFTQGDVRFGFQAIQRMMMVAHIYNHAIIQPIFLRNGKVDNAGMKIIWPGYGKGITKNQSGLGAYETDVCTSITFLISKQVLGLVGFYDQNFCPAYYEDVDWAIRSRKSGVKHLVANSAIVHHRHNESFSKVYSNLEISDICRKNRRYLISKHYYGVDRLIRLTVASCFDIVKKTADIIFDRWVSANNRK